MQLKAKILLKIIQIVMIFKTVKSIFKKYMLTHMIAISSRMIKPCIAQRSRRKIRKRREIVGIRRKNTTL